MFRSVGNFPRPPMRQVMPSAAQLSTQGWQHLQAGRYGEAIADLNEAIRLNPWDAVAFHNRGAAKLNVIRP